MYRFILRRIRVSLVALNRSSEGKWSWKWDGRWRAINSGETRMSPHAADLSRITARYTFCILGGPLANLLTASIALPLALLTRGALAGLSMFFVIGSVGFTFLNLIPHKGLIGRSDGGKLYDMIFYPGRRERLLFKFCLSARLYEIRALTVKHRHHEALEVFDEQMRLAENLLQDDDSVPLRNWMFAFRPTLEKATASCNQRSDPATEPEPDLEIPPAPEPA